MTGSIPDPRLEAGIERLLMSHPSWFKRLSTSRNRSPEHPDHADVRYAAQTIVEAVLRAIDAADEASGVRRVTAQELAAERQRVEVASIDLDELPSWDELAEATGATLINHEVGCSGEYETMMHWPDGRVAHNRDRLAIISADAELDVAAIERAHRASEAQYQADRDAKRTAFNAAAAGGVS